MRLVSATVVRLIALALMAHIALSWRLWYAGMERTFPLLPLWGEAHLPAELWGSTSVAVQQISEALLLGVWVLTLVLSLVWPNDRRLLLGSMLALLAFVVQDLNRLQPWTYFYWLAWGILFFERKNPAATLRLLVAGVYVWGGLHKLTPYFVEDNFPWFCEAFAWTKPLGQYPELGYAVAVGEALLGVGLMWERSRPFIRYLAVGFHAFIVLALSPLGLGWNAVVLPWNVAMAGMVWVLGAPSQTGRAGIWPGKFGHYEKREKHPTFNVFRARPNKFGRYGGGSLWWMRSRTSLVVVGLVWLSPALNLIGWWPEAFSWKMYSNTQPEAGFYVWTEALLPPSRRSIWEQYAQEETGRLLFDDWAMAELHVPMFNHRHTQRQLALYLCEGIVGACEAGLWRLEVKPWNRNGEHWEETPCSSLEVE